MTILRSTLWLASLVSFISGALLLMRGLPTLGYFLMLTSAICVGEAERQASRRRERLNYEQRFGSSRQEMKRAIDVVEVGRVRDQEGDVAAIRLVRRELPGVPLKEVVKLVQEL